MSKVEFYKHNLTDEERDSVLQTLSSVFLTTGPKTKEFEETFAEYLDMKYCVGTTSWTMGAFITLKAMGIGPGDEVITTPLTFIATPNIVLHCGAKPVFVDVDPKTGNIDPEEIKKAITPKTKAIIPVHLYGQMCDMEAISKIAKDNNLKVIEDCAHCIEGSYKGIKPGQLSDAAVFSFYATKNITSGEGGAIVTNDEDLQSELIKYRLHGMSKSAADRYSKKYNHWDMEVLGFKCNMTDIQASMLLGQLDKIDEFRKSKESIDNTYRDRLSSLKDVSFPAVLEDTVHARHISTIWVKPDLRDTFISKLQDHNIGVAVNFRAVHLLKYYSENFGYKRGDFPNAELIGDSTLTIPLYPKLTEEEVNRVCESFRSVHEELC